MTRPLSFLQMARLHGMAAGIGGSILVFGLLGPLLPSFLRTEGLVSVGKLALLIVFTTVVFSAPFSLFFWLTHNAKRTLTKPISALFGAFTALMSYLLIFVIAGEDLRLSGDFPLTLGLLLGAGATAGLFFRWRLIGSAKRLVGKGQTDEFC